MIGEKINATGMTGFVSEERTKSQWGQWRREKSANKKIKKCTCLSDGCINACLRMAIYLCLSSFVCERVHSSLRDIPPPRLAQAERWDRDSVVTVVLTKSLKRSFSPLRESTMSSGIMLMYHGMDEMAGTHWRPHANMEPQRRRRKHTV